MKMANENKFDKDSPAEAFSIDSTLKALVYKLQNFPQQAEVIFPECDKLKTFLASTSDKMNPEKIKTIVPYLDKCSDNIKAQLFLLLEIFIPKISDPWVILEELLSLKDDQRIFQTLDLMKDLAEKKNIAVDSRIINFFAEKQDIEYSVLRSPEALEKILSVVVCKEVKSKVYKDNPLLEIYLAKEEKKAQVLAAKLLDLKNIPPSESTVENLLGKSAAKLLLPYLSYTRANHSDLLYLIPAAGKPPPIAESLLQCEKICGDYIIKEVISRLGWKKINYGLSVKHYTGITIGGSLPVYVSDSEAKLFEDSCGAKRISGFYLFTAHGGLPFEAGLEDKDDKPVNLFRSYNLAHANLLQEILDVAPLTNEKVKSIIEQMDKIVSDFVRLFSSYTDECSILNDVYNKIKNKIIAELTENAAGSHLSADITRLVQMFEDPHSVGEVHTLHGLKRYLHQRGLQLGFKLVDQSRSPNQSIHLALATGSRVVAVVRNINFANFEAAAEEEFSFSEIPYPVEVVVKAFERQLLHGQESFPSVNIFCYGNEVHYFVWFRNHPVFIRIDFSPPLQGGMIDLQYFGVSNYEIADHPDISLNAIRFFFQHLEFDVKLDGTHIHARYDKERALDLKQLCEQVEFLFCLVPYLMDLDWVIGSLNLPSDAKRKVTDAWVQLFRQWGVLPVDKLITKDRLGILQDVLVTTEGEHELVWSGDGEYQDRFTIKAESGFYDNIYNSIEKLGIKIPKFSEANLNIPGQIFWENLFLNRLRSALEEGEITETSAGFYKAPEELFQKVHEAVWFAEIISRGGVELKSAVALAKVIIPFEQTLKFQSSGTLENFKVQSAVLPLIGEDLKIYVLRDSKEIIRLAFYVRGQSLHRKRNNVNDIWKINAELSPVGLMSLLRANNYTVSGSEQNIESLEDEVQKISDELRLPRKQLAEVRTPGEKTITGLRASPGRATGRVILGTAGRMPEDFDEHIFVASSVSPDENTILFHSAGIVATGGGILSHAGLIATQFNKPAIIISGTWKQGIDGTLILLYLTTEFQIEHRKEKNFNVSIYYDLHEVEHQMQDGDLVVLDADDGVLHVLGQNRDTIALFEELKSLGKTNEAVSATADAREILVLRGKKLHIRHQIEKLLTRISEPFLAGYAIGEILVGNFLEGNKSTPEEKAYLLNLILQNDKTGKTAEGYLLQIIDEIENKFVNAYIKAEQVISKASFPFEIVIPRLDALRIYEMMKSVIASAGTVLKETMLPEESNLEKINQLSILRLNELRIILIERIKELTGLREKREHLRHIIRQLNRIDLLLGKNPEEQMDVKKLQAGLDLDDRNKCAKLAKEFILKPADGSLELFPLTGWKAANLAELETVGGKGFVPPWFVVTDYAFQTVLKSPIIENVSVSGGSISRGTPLCEAIESILLRTDSTNREKSLYIRNLWESISLPEEIKCGVIEAYREIEKEFLSSVEDKTKYPGFYVAIRSSSCEEDAEVAARAGEFETYLFISGEEQVPDYLKRTWSGLWTERAIHNRTVFGNHRSHTTGGVIIQRIVWSRVSGVLQTINVPRKDLREIVINAGLGLGEGVVSGKVAADQVIVSKEGNFEKGTLNFNYITSDKKEQVVFNSKAGYGTVLSPTLYHQRFRAALEYIELCDLVSVASRLEAVYGYPLDIEFGIEGTKLWILQVRPVATFLPAFHETLNKYPLKKKNSETTQELLN
jgi:phosphohistidine swiveling domain-containing protein